MRLSTLAIITTFSIGSTSVIGGPIAWAACQTACNIGYATCCSRLGFVAGTVTLGVGVPAAVAGCSVAQGACMAACTPLLIAPTP